MTDKQKAIIRYRESDIEKEEQSPLERLRFFCSLAMSGDDWLDAEMFFDSLALQVRRTVDPGPWTTGETSDGRHYLESSEFTHDVRLYVDGDFAWPGDKASYAQGLASQLNNAPVSAEPVAVPHGWKLVPIEPAEEMLVNVDEDVGGSCHSCSIWRASEDDCKRVWAAMIEAVPAAPVAVQAKEPTLDKPAKVGNGRFGVGIKWSTVIAAAQRHYEYEVTPSKEAKRIKEGAQKLGQLQELIAAQTQQVDRSPEMQGKPVDNHLDLQGHASVIFAKAVAWADARVESALIQEQGKPHGQSCDEAAQTHYELVQALRNLQAAQQPVSGAEGLPEELEYSQAWRKHAALYGHDSQHAFTAGWNAAKDDMLSHCVESAIHIAEEKVKAQQPVSGADGLTDAAIEMLAKQYDCHNAPGFMGFAKAAAALAQQDADKVDAALAEMVHAMFRSGNDVPVTRITIDRKQYEAAVNAGRKEQE